MYTPVLVFALLLLATTVLTGDPSCRVSGLQNRGRTVLGVKSNVLDIYASRIQSAQTIIQQNAFTTLGNNMSPVPFVGDDGTACVSCQVDCMSQVRIWPSGANYYQDTLFVDGSCKNRYFGYGCRKMLGCNLMHNDVFFFSALMACAQYSGCVSKYPNVFAPGNFNAGFVASIDYYGTVGSNSPAVTIDSVVNTFWAQVVMTPSLNVKSVSVQPVGWTNSFALNNIGGNTYAAGPPSAIAIGSKINVIASMTTGETVTTQTTFWPTPVLTVVTPGANEYYVQIQATPSTYIASMNIIPTAWNNTGMAVPRSSWSNDVFVSSISKSIPCGTNVNVQLIMTNGDVAGNFLVWDVC